MKSIAFIAVLVSLSGSGVFAGPCKPVTSQATQVTSATTEESTFIDLTTTIAASETTAESLIPSTTDVSSETTVDSTVESTTTTAIAETTPEETHATTTTSEPSTTTTSPPQCPTPVTCNNLGFDWAYYSNPAQNTDTTYSNFNPTSFKQQSPVYAGTTREIGGLYQSGNGATGPIYGTSNSFDLDFFALNHHGYLYSCEAGTYKFDIPYANDAVYLWIGAKAYAGWTSGNADAKALYNQPDHIAGSASFEINLPAGVYIPIRLVYGQAQYGGGFTFKVTAPNGQVLVDDDVDDSPYVVRNSCDGVLAPQYPRFGQEI